jgi:transcriptional regulator GlxA family with amidase domain
MSVFLQAHLSSPLISVTIGIQRPADNSSKEIPMAYGMLLFRSFDLLDVFGPLEALKMVSNHYHMDLALISTTLDPVSAEPRLPSSNPFNSSFYPKIVPTHTLETAPKDLDVLIVPGGGGTRASDQDLDVYFKYLRTTFPRLKYLITVCTGAWLTGRAGLLDGKRATTNKGAFEQVKVAVPNVKWEPHARWVVDGNMWTSSGISAGIDVTLEFIECIYGEALAKRITTSMEYERHTDPRWDPFSESRE